TETLWLVGRDRLRVLAGVPWRMAAVPAGEDAALTGAVAEGRDQAGVPVDTALPEIRAAWVRSAADSRATVDAARIHAIVMGLVGAAAVGAAGALARVDRKGRADPLGPTERNPAVLDPVPQITHEPVHRVSLEQLGRLGRIDAHADQRGDRGNVRLGQGR